MEKDNNWIKLPEQNDRITAPITIDNHQFMASLDTGSTRSFISMQSAKKIMTKENLRRILGSMTLANGSKIVITQALDVVVQLGHARAKMLILVLPKVLGNIVLGLDFMRETSTVLQVGDTSIPLGTLPESNIWLKGSLLSVSCDTPTRDNNYTDLMALENDELSDSKSSFKNAGQLLENALSETNSEDSKSSFKNAGQLLENALRETISEDSKSSFKNAGQLLENALRETISEPASPEVFSRDKQNDEVVIGEDWEVAPQHWRVKTPERRLPLELIIAIKQITKTKLERRTRNTLNASGYKFCVDRTPKRMLVVSFAPTRKRRSN